MAINFIPNDPKATSFNTVRRQSALPGSKRSRVGFEFPNLPAQDTYSTNQIQWLQWQVHQAANSALRTFEGIHGPIDKWPRSSRAKLLTVFCNQGVDINAYYDGEDLAFFHYPKGRKNHFTGSSTDVVAHEVGHALLDAIRPQLWDITFTEVAAFHESFGDCIAILTALSDIDIRRQLVSKNMLSKTNFVETWGEHLAWMAGPGFHPRQALNSLQWSLAGGDPHSFSQVFTGCFYDLIGLEYQAGAKKDQAALWRAAKTVAKLLFDGATTALITPRFYQSVGRVMVLNAGLTTPQASRIRAAFDGHGIALASSALTSPRAKVAGTMSQRSATNWRLSPRALADLRGRLGAQAGSPLQMRTVNLGGVDLAEATYARTIQLGQLQPAFGQVATDVPEAVLVGAFGYGTKNATLATMSPVPDTKSTEDEVSDFVAGLIRRHQIEFVTKKAAKSAQALKVSKHATSLGVPDALRAELPRSGVTHRVLERTDGTRLLQRVRFACQCCGKQS